MSVLLMPIFQYSMKCCVYCNVIIIVSLPHPLISSLSNSLVIIKLLQTYQGSSVHCTCNYKVCSSSSQYLFYSLLPMEFSLHLVSMNELYSIMFTVYVKRLWHNEMISGQNCFRKLMCPYIVYCSQEP